jgi:hypothetical protein
MAYPAGSSAVYVSPRDQMDRLGQADACLEGQRPTVESLEPPPTSGRGSSRRPRTPPSGRVPRPLSVPECTRKIPGAGHTGSWARLSMDQCEDASPDAIFEPRPCCSKAECVQPDCTRQGERHGRPGRQEGQDKESAAARDEAEEQEPKEVGQGAVQAIGRKHLGAINQPDERSTTA